MDSEALRGALPDRIETERLVLRAPERADIASIAALANNRKIHAMTTLPHPYAESDAAHFIENIARTAAEHAYAIVLANGDLIGMIGLHLHSDATPEIGYWIGQPYWGRGYATEAAAALIDAVRDTRRCATLRAKARSENGASRAVPEKLDFVFLQEAISGCGPHKDIPVTTYELTIAAETT